MSIVIYSDNSIELDGKKIGLKVAQDANGTIVYTPESRISGKRYSEHKMPYARYSLVHDNPASGAAGRAQFERDIRNLIASL